MRWKKANRKAKVHALDYFFCDASLDLEEKLIVTAPEFSLDAANKFALRFCGGVTPCQVLYADLGTGVTGYYDPPSKNILINSSNQFSDAVLWRTLCHEVAHHFIVGIEGLTHGPHHSSHFVNTLRWILNIWIDDFAS